MATAAVAAFLHLPGIEVACHLVGMLGFRNDEDVIDTASPTQQLEPRPLLRDLVSKNSVFEKEFHRLRFVTHFVPGPIEKNAR